RHGHQGVPAALLAGLNDMALHLVEPRLAGMHDAVLSLQWHEGGDAKLGELFDKELAAVALGKGGGDFEVERQLAPRLGDVRDFEGDVAALDFDDAGGVFAAVAVEEADGVARAKATDCGKMVGFGAFQKHRSGLERAVDVKP